MATIKDIARALDISPATVSRALNDFPEIKAETRALVKQEAKRINYRPNRTARRLVSGQAHMAAMVIPAADDLSRDPHLFEAVTGLSHALQAHQLDLIFHVATGQDPVDPYRRLVQQNTVDGFVITGPEANDPRIAYLRDEGIPFVVHGRDCAAPDYAFYDIDNYDAARQAGELLLDFGHTELALIGGENAAHYAMERRRGFNDAITNRAGSTPIILPGPNSEKHGYEAMKSLLPALSPNPPTGILTSATQVAMGAMIALEEVGLKVGQDISLISHDDAVPHLRAKDFSPALTVTRAPLRDAIKPMAEMLHARIGGADAATLQVTQPVELILRQSTSPYSGPNIQEPANDQSTQH